MSESNVETIDSTARPIVLEDVAALRRAGVIDSAEFLDAARACRDADYWADWSLKALLALGAGHLLAGIVFFFAYNWADLPLLGKFAVLEAGIVLTAVAALVVRLERPGGQALLIGATVLTGTLLAVIGQVYQTGADAWQLFALWALLTLPWALASRSAAHWLVWLVVAFVAATTYGFQVLIVTEVLTYVEFSCLSAIAVALVLVVREALVARGTDWLAPGWTRLLPAFVAPMIVFAKAVGYVFGVDENLVAGITLIVFVALLIGIYQRFLPDFAAVAIGTAFGSLFLMAIGGRIIRETMGFEFDQPLQVMLSLTVLTFWCAGVTTVTVKLLIGLRRRMRRGMHDD
ncbi:MAG: DUF2157 domain-containing protein [Woeseiaceae bacterium]|jgi:uncharacterized membrane protein|nr:DUF2157 domain-containing protein [Woeseiaceae bacterium]